MKYVIKDTKTKEQVLGAAYVLFCVLYPKEATRLTAHPLVSVFNNDIGAFLKSIIADYSCSEFSKKAPEFRTVRDGYGYLNTHGTLISPASYLQKIIKVKSSQDRARLFIPLSELQPHTCEQVKRVWVIIDPEFELGGTPEHHVNCFLEDRLHDWDIKKENNTAIGISYYGMLLRNAGRLLIEFKEKI